MHGPTIIHLKDGDEDQAARSATQDPFLDVGAADIILKWKDQADDDVFSLPLKSSVVCWMPNFFWQSPGLFFLTKTHS